MILRALIPLALAGPLLAVPDGFEIHDFAGPPDADYPAAITVAPNGDVYVSSDRNSSLGKDPHMGRIIRCRDTDGDGRADHFVHFVPDVDSPRGGHFVGDTLYLIHPPYLSAFRDTDGDGIADEKRQLVEGFAFGLDYHRGADHTTNGVRMGIDGWLYVSVGDFGMPAAKGADGSALTLRGGGVVRVRPDGSGLEPYSLMLRNICDTAISPALDLFSRDNTNDGKGWNTRLHHHTALVDHGYPRLYQNFAAETVAPLADYGGGSGTGALWLHEPGFPGDFGDMLFTCDWTTGHVYYHPRARDGESFRIGQESFHEVPRATDIDVDGSSRLYIADWRGGRYSYAGDDQPVGMIQQVTVAEGTPAEFVDVTRVADAELVNLLASRSAVQRLEAQREILRRGSRPALEAGVLELARDAGRPEYARVAALFTFKQLCGTKSTGPIAELVDDLAMREFALRAMADRRSQLDGVPAGPYLEALRDPNPRVILQALVGLERLGVSEHAADIIAASSTWRESGTSPRLRHTAIAALTSLRNVSALLAGAADPATRAVCLRALQGIHTREAVDALSGLASGGADEELRLGALAALARLHFREQAWDLESWWGTRPDDRGPYFEPVEWEQSGRIRATLERGFDELAPARRTAFLDLLALNRIPVSKLELAGLDPVLAALGAPSPTDGDLALLTDAAKDSRRPLGQRLACYRAIRRGGDPELVTPARLAVLASWSEQQQTSAEVVQAIDDFVNETQRGSEVRRLRRIAARQSDAASRIAWKALLTVRTSPLTEDRARRRVDAMVAENPREVGFFQAIAELGLTGYEAQIEVGLSSDNDELIAAATAAREATASPSGQGPKVAGLSLEEVAKAAMEGSGDLGDGKRLFTTQGCIACHSVDPKAEQKGPYLGSAGSKFTREYLIESILEPNKVVAQGFRTRLFTMKDGTVHMGFVTAEEDGRIELRNIAGQAQTLSRAEVAKDEEVPQSMMPPGLVATLSVDEITSLIDYMASLRHEQD